MNRPRGLRRRVDDFHESPSSIRTAVQIIAAATVVTTLAGAFLAWTFDRRDFSSFGDALWWALQTITTVGYGDVTPTNTIGRIIGAVVIVYAVAFLTILTATITTTFVQHARADADGDRDLTAVLARLDEVTSHLEAIERQLAAAAPEAHLEERGR